MYLVPTEKDLVGKTIKGIVISWNYDATFIRTTDGGLAAITFSEEDPCGVFNRSRELVDILAGKITYSYSSTNNFLRFLLEENIITAEEFVVCDIELLQVSELDKEKQLTRQAEVRKQQYLRLKEEFEGAE